MKSIGIVGARGFAGAELIKLIGAHSAFELQFVSSRKLAGQVVDMSGIDGSLRYENLSVAQVAERKLDAVVLAMPNGAGKAYADALDAKTVIVDLSADYRFDNGWYYGLPELTRKNYNGEKCISNPGCYATAMQLLIAPLKNQLDGLPVCFGVSGYSGAGTAASERNDPDKLNDNLMPYALTGHIHEREISYQLDLPIAFTPHVAPHFRGITLTAHLPLQSKMTAKQLGSVYQQAYAGEALIRIQNNAPWVSHVAGKHHVDIGGITVSPGGKRAVVVAVLDNLLKGAATQAMQNLNNAFGFNELEGIKYE